MTIELKKTETAMIAELNGDIDLSNSANVRDTLLKELAAGHDVIVDMSRVGYIDSSCVASFVKAFQEARKSGRKFVLAAVAPKPLRVMQLARLDKVFTFADTVEEA